MWHLVSGDPGRLHTTSVVVKCPLCTGFLRVCQGRASGPAAGSAARGQETARGAYWCMAPYILFKMLPISHGMHSMTVCYPCLAAGYVQGLDVGPELETILGYLNFSTVPVQLAPPAWKQMSANLGCSSCYRVEICV